MTQPSPTPVPDHGTGWGLLLLFSALYGIVAVLGAGTIVAIAATRLDWAVPKVVRYPVVTVLLAALAVSGFTVLVAARARMYDVVALLLLVVFLPLTLIVFRHRGTTDERLAVLAHAAMAWSLPFLVGFGVIAFLGTMGGEVPPEVVGIVAAAVVIAGTAWIERLSFFPSVERQPE